MKSALEQYEKRIEDYQASLKKQNNIINAICTMRLITFFAAAGLGIYLYFLNKFTAAALCFLLLMGAFVVLVVFHQKYIEMRKYTAALLEINLNSEKRNKGEWKGFADTGEEFLDGDHEFSGDLDIFGRGSLFQWINIAVTSLGRQRLKDTLINPVKNKAEILTRQEAIAELSKMLDFRQRFQAEGMVSSGKMADTKELLCWAEKRDVFYCSISARIIFRLIPLVTIILFLIYFISGNISVYIPVSLLAVQALMTGANSKKRNDLLGIINKYYHNIKAFSGMLKILEDQQFKSNYIESLKGRLNNGGEKAYKRIESLNRINNAVSNRYHMLYIVLNILFLLDYQFMILIECWKKDSGRFMGSWLEILGEMEALSSLAVIAYDNPSWCFPEVIDGSPALRGSPTLRGNPALSGENIGHPLLGHSCVCNSISFRYPVNVLLITGSNMSGKSTFLRTLGINLVLAYSGSPVFARSFSCSIMDLYTCMRVRDDLDRNISSFYAELIRIKSIVKAVEGGKKVFFLLDEIFKGTNSIDRHTGARVLIKKLSKGKVLGLVSTHDLELGCLEDECGTIRNYHFQEHYRNNQICFDYRLHTGPSTTRNAIYLMKLAGIDMED